MTQVAIFQALRHSKTSLEEQKYEWYEDIG